MAEPKKQALLGFLVLALLWTDVYTSAPSLSPTVQRSVYEPLKMRAILKLPSAPQAGEGRFMIVPSMLEKLHSISLPNAADEIIIHRVTLYDNFNLLDDVPKVDGLFSLYLRETVEVLGKVYDSENHHTDLKGLKDFMCVSHITPSDGAPEQAMDWVTRDNALPRIVGGQQPMFASDAERDAALMSTNFDPRRIVFLPMAARDAVKAARTSVKINSPEIHAQQVRFETEANAPAIVTIAQGYYPPWHAYVDGQRVALWQANVGFQALEVPGGKHNVRVVYEDTLFQLGAIISIATFVAAVLMCLGFRQNEQNVQNEKRSPDSILHSGHSVDSVKKTLSSAWKKKPS
jgi:hypothetical protein